MRKLLQRREFPRHKIVSLRLNDHEWEELSSHCNLAGKTVSEYLREALTHWEEASGILSHEGRGH